MTATIARGPEGRRRGYTLIELLVVNLMLSLLVVLLAGAWRAFGPLCVEVIARGRVVNEANIAAQAIAQEPTLPRPPGLVLVQVEAVQVASGWTALQFDYAATGGPTVAPWPYVAQYAFEATPDDRNSAGRLVRYVGDPTAGLVTSIVVARHVESAVAMTLNPVGTTEVSRVGFTVSFSYRGSHSQYTFEVHQ